MRTIIVRISNTANRSMVLGAGSGWPCMPLYKSQWLSSVQKIKNSLGAIRMSVSARATTVAALVIAAAAQSPSAMSVDSDPALSEVRVEADVDKERADGPVIGYRA